MNIGTVTKSSVIAYYGICFSLLKPVVIGSLRARNNGRSADNVRANWGVDWSTFRLAGHIDRSHSILLKMT